MKVKTLRPHMNGYGGIYRKRKGIIYDHPSPEGLIRDGLVDAYSEVSGRKGTGKGDDGTQDGDGKARRSKGSKKRTRTRKG